MQENFHPKLVLQVGFYQVYIISKTVCNLIPHPVNKIPEE